MPDGNYHHTKYCQSLGPVLPPLIRQSNGPTYIDVTLLSHLTLKLLTRQYKDNEAENFVVSFHNTNLCQLHDRNILILLLELRLVSWHDSHLLGLSVDNETKQVIGSFCYTTSL